MKPNEFWKCTYREAYTFVKSNSLQRENDYKRDIILFDALGEKIINAVANKKAKNISLVRSTFKNLFEEELTPHNQTIEEQIRILRSMK